MPDGIEIKGLAQRVSDAKKAISDARAASADLSEATTAFTTDLKDLTKQVKKHHEDLKFEAETLGNSGGPSAQPEGGTFSDGNKT